MNKKGLKTLEFDKVLHMLSSCATCESVREEIQNLVPKEDLAEAKEALCETDEAAKCLLKLASPPSCPVKNQEQSIKRAMNGGVLSMAELLDIARLLSAGKAYHTYGEGMEEFPKLKGYVSEIFLYDDLQREIETAIVSEDEMADAASADLLSIRRTMRGLNSKIRDTLSGLISSGNYSKYLQESLITTRGGRYVVPVKAEYKANVPGLVHDTSSTGATLFIEPMAVVEANNRLKQEETKEKYEIERILQTLSQTVADNGEDILINIGALKKLDFAFAKGKFSISYFGVMPRLNDRGIIQLKKARHPLLAKDKVVPIDVHLGDEFDALVITGPNTGGKTVTLKTIGLLCLMAQAGLHVPAADGAEISFFDEIFADIGDEQSIEQSLSTFSSHMTNIIKIVLESGNGTLVLFDELCAGTDPTEGAALAMSILEHVRLRGAKIAATTHYSELKLYAMTTDRVQNASCAFDVESLKPTYKLNIGVPGKSNAFAISQKLGLQKVILDKAEEYLSGENIRFEDVLSELEQNRQKAKAEHDKMESLARQAEQDRERIKKETERIEKEREKARKDALSEAQKIIDSAREEAETMLAEVISLREQKKEKEAQQQLEKIRKELKEKSGDISRKMQKKKSVPGAVPKKLIPGSRVYVTDTDTVGTVINPPDKKGRVLVQTGVLKITVPLESLRYAEDNEGEKIAKSYSLSRGTASKTQVISPELDIRGKYAEEGISEVQRFIDDAAVANLKTVTIVHGKGTGALRQAVHDYLKTCPYVDDFRLGKFGEGDLGVTVVHLK